MTPTVTCPSCGAQTQGKFCAECGQPLGERKCPKCGAKVSARAKFCPDCGTTVGGAAKAGGAPVPAAAAGRGLGDKFPWIIAGLAVLALVATIIVVITRRQPAQEQQAGGMPFDPNRGTTDLTAMSPREAADRLYNRTASAASQGDSQQVQFFGPMTIQAYGSVTPLDADARLHIGLVHLNLGNAAGAEAQADTIARASRTHLFAAVLKAQAAALRSDATAERRAVAEFQRNYDAEMAKGLTEYGEHTVLLNDMRAAAPAGSAPR